MSTPDAPDARIEPLSAATEAIILTDQIKVGVEAVWELIKRAYQIRAWEPLGYASWDMYCTQEFGASRLRLPREDRQEVVASLREIGMSTRAIASATGVSKGTVQNALSAAQNCPPEPTVVDAEIVGDPTPTKVVGLDGKQYDPGPHLSWLEPKRPQRPPLPRQFQNMAVDLTQVIARAERLKEDDRFKANKASISDVCVPMVRRAVEVLQALLDDLGED